MYENAYEIVVLAMRYVFVALILYILLRLVLHSITEFRAVQQIKEQVRGVSSGYLEVLAPQELRGETFVLRRENSIGRSKRCDIFIRHESLALLHAFIYEKKQGLFLTDYENRANVYLNGELVKKGEELLYTADELQLGDVKLKLHLNGEQAEEADGQ
ncbi:MAG: FHA domain-containing protein [Clostridiales bacterium]|nr:FHA domain-containing protein [Clostridiales bacterium]